jgi:uncharacterized membrane protein
MLDYRFQSFDHRSDRGIHPQPLVFIVVLLLAGFVLHFERKNGVKDSVLLFVFWLLMALVHALPLASALERAIKG